ncbi:MAG: hypothetical protein ACFB4J_13625 [Elainellaceae cyanobacterium]
MKIKKSPASEFSDIEQENNLKDERELEKDKLRQRERDQLLNKLANANLGSLRER